MQSVAYHVPRGVCWYFLQKGDGGMSSCIVTGDRRRSEVEAGKGLLGLCAYIFTGNKHPDRLIILIAKLKPLNLLKIYCPLNTEHVYIPDDIHQGTLKNETNLCGKEEGGRICEGGIFVR